MTRIPIYQMTYGQDREGNTGLVFPSEQEGYDSQSILFTIPIVEPFRHSFDLLKFFDYQEFYFPFLLGEKYYDLKAKVNFPDLVFSVPEKSIDIVFEIDRGNFGVWEFFPFRRRQYKRTKYVGKQNGLLMKTYDFMNLLPVNLYAMDELYNKHQGVFVGLTPNFGNNDFNR